MDMGRWPFGTQQYAQFGSNNTELVSYLEENTHFIVKVPNNSWQDGKLGVLLGETMARRMWNL